MDVLQLIKTGMGDPDAEGTGEDGVRAYLRDYFGLD